MQELIGYYIPMEEYYMRESVNKVFYWVLYSICSALYSLYLVCQNDLKENSNNFPQHKQ